MSTDSRRRMGALTALVLGLFVGLTLLPIPITGPVGRYIGHGLWQILGAGALGIPLLGAGLALAGFDRVVALDPDNAVGWNNRANTLVSLNRLEEAGISWRVYFDELQLVSFTGVESKADALLSLELLLPPPLIAKVATTAPATMIAIRTPMIMIGGRLPPSPGSRV